MSRDQTDRKAKLAEYGRKYRAANKAKIRERRRRWWARNGDIKFIYGIMTKYKLTIDQYHALFEKQNEACAICKSTLEQAKTCVDHCHTSGRIRGLLCDFCNKALGFFKDSESNLQSAIYYLQRKRSIYVA